MSLKLYTSHSIRARAHDDDVHDQLNSGYAYVDVAIACLQVVKSELYPRLPAGIKAFRDEPVHGPIVAVQVWYSDQRIFGFRSTFLDKYRSPVHGYTIGNTSTVGACTLLLNTVVPLESGLLRTSL